MQLEKRSSFKIKKSPDTSREKSARDSGNEDFDVASVRSATTDRAFQPRTVQSRPDRDSPILYYSIVLIYTYSLLTSDVFWSTYRRTLQITYVYMAQFIIRFIAIGTRCRSRFARMPSHDNNNAAGYRPNDRRAEIKICRREKCRPITVKRTATQTVVIMICIFARAVSTASFQMSRTISHERIVRRGLL